MLTSTVRTVLYKDKFIKTIVSSYKLMKKIVKGNDFTLNISVMKMVDGTAKALPLPACTDIVVQVCIQFIAFLGCAGL